MNPPTLEEQLSRLLSIHEIRNLKARYCQHADRQEWEQFHSLFLPDCAIDISEALPAADGGVGPNFPEETSFHAESADELVATLKQRLRGARTMHQLSEPVFEEITDDSARAIWPISDLVLRPEENGLPSWVGHGYYHESYQKADGRWRIATMRVVRLRIDQVPSVATF